MNILKKLMHWIITFVLSLIIALPLIYIAIELVYIISPDKPRLPDEDQIDLGEMGKILAAFFSAIILIWSPSVGVAYKICRKWLKF